MQVENLDIYYIGLYFPIIYLLMLGIYLLFHKACSCISTNSKFSVFGGMSQSPC